MVRFDPMFIVFALIERKNDKQEKGTYRSAEGSERQLRKSYMYYVVSALMRGLEVECPPDPSFVDAAQLLSNLTTDILCHTV
jgi:hypothetical protein